MRRTLFVVLVLVSVVCASVWAVYAWLNDVDRNLRVLMPAGFIDPQSRGARLWIKKNWANVAGRVKCEAISNNNGLVRVACIEIIGELQDVSGREILLVATRDLSPNIRGAALAALGKLNPDDRTIGVLVTGLSDTYAFNASLASKLLAGYGERALDPLLELIRSQGNEEAKFWALGAIVDMGPRGVRSGQALSDVILSDKSERGRLAFLASYALQQEWPASRKTVESLLGEQMPKARFWGLAALREIVGDETIRVGLAKPFLSDSDPMVRDMAAQVVARASSQPSSAPARSLATE